MTVPLEALLLLAIVFAALAVSQVTLLEPANHKSGDDQSLRTARDGIGPTAITTGVTNTGKADREER